MEITINNLTDKLISNDKEYLESYFDICKLLYEKKVILSKIKRLQETDKPEEISSLKEKLHLRNQEIKEKEFCFWQKISSLEIDFKIERFFSEYNLCLYEKRLFLFLVYLELFCLLDNFCCIGDLLQILDTEDSVFDKIKSLKYFSDDASLFKNGFVTKREDSWTNCYRKSEVFITPEGLNAFVCLLEGQNVNFKNSNNESSQVTVGYIKEPEYSFDDIVLKKETKEKILFLLNSKDKEKLNQINLLEKIKKDKGLVFLFYGPPGTGKSITAEAIAMYFGKKLLIVEFPKITSKWFGETEKAISRMFKEAKENDLVLCVDEADALLYNRNFAVQEHDIRFVNIMLKGLENFQGIVILTTNMDNLLDPALERRVTLKVKFELPDENLRAQIWRLHIPDNIKITQDVDFLLLAKKFNFSGGYIKNAVMHALRRLLNENRTTLTMDDLLFGAELEQEGMYLKENKRKIGFSASI